MTFIFKQFTIRQDRCAMKITSDACVFGTWVEVTQTSRILDVGTGTGLLALMVAQRTSGSIDALEIEAEAAGQAEENVVHSPWSERISVFHRSLAEHQRLVGSEQYDTVICNPPFHSQKLKSHSPLKRLAWHEDQLGLEKLMESADYFLKNDGSIYILIPITNRSKLENIASANNLYPTHYCELRSFSDRPPHRLMARYSKIPESLTITELVMYQQHQRFTGECQERLYPYFTKL